MRRQAFKYELEPNGRQTRQLNRFAGGCRYVFNRALRLQQDRYQLGLKHLTYVALSKELTYWRNSPETAWLAQGPAAAQQQKLIDLCRAFENFFAGRAGLPRLKRKYRNDRFRYPDGKNIKLDQPNSRIYLPKLGWMPYRNSRKLLGRIKNATVTRQCDKWFVSLQTEQEVHTTPERKTSAIGIDVGVSKLATLSDGTVYPPQHSFKKHETRLRKATQRLARKQKGSKNRRKAVLELAKVHARIANVRHDHLHKISTTIAKNHGTVFVEDLQITNMTKSARGTTAEPGRRVKAKSGLNKAILDQGWGEFRRQLAYKLDWRGGQLIAVPPHYTSQKCPTCGHTAKTNRPTQSKFACEACGYEENADIVGAVNVLRAGQARIACEVNGTSRQQQEPAEADSSRGSTSRSGAVGIPVL